MKERPILFSGPMVRGICEDRKNLTRRIVKWRGLERGLNLSFSGLSVERSGSNFVLTSPTRDSYAYRSVPQPCPYGQVGDRLWVRETWGIGSRPDPWGGFEGIEYRADQALLEPDDLLPCYKATTPDDVCLGDYSSGWKPSIHMPRWASRITLEITGVRVERLQSISDEDCIAEGIELSHIDSRSRKQWRMYPHTDGMPGPDGELVRYCGSPYNSSPRESFKSLWLSINGPGSWDPNPWVWVVEFKRLESPQ
ncbi:MAG: hypothetical protein QM749_00420 [Aquabacterium sp.]